MRPQLLLILFFLTGYDSFTEIHCGKELTPEIKAQYPIQAIDIKENIESKLTSGYVCISKSKLDEHSFITYEIYTKENEVDPVSMIEDIEKSAVLLTKSDKNIHYINVAYRNHDKKLMASYNCDDELANRCHRIE